MLEARHKMKLFFTVRPWEDEPDHAEWVQEPSGYRCRIVRNEITGTLCGYVGVPKGNKFWGLDYAQETELSNIGDDVHGGLTYSAKGDDDYWYFGFDTAHADDFPPKIVELLIDKGRKDFKFYDSMNYRTWEYVENEIHWLGKRLWAYDMYEKEKGGN